MTESNFVKKLKELDKAVLSVKNSGDDPSWQLATLIFDRGSDVLPFIKKHCPESYVEVLEGYIMGHHDT